MCCPCKPRYLSQSSFVPGQAGKTQGFCQCNTIKLEGKAPKITWSHWQVHSEQVYSEQVYKAAQGIG